MNVELKKILCPVDFSRNAAYATRYALAFAEAHKAQLLLLQVEEPYVPCIPMDYPGIDSMDPLCNMDDEMEETDTGETEASEKDDSLWRLAEDLHQGHQGVRIKPLRAIGKAFVEIVRTAKEYDVDLIVIGTHGRTGLAHMLIGSTAEKVVRMAPCPVLTVKHPDHEFVMP
ncbi:MAG: universal stress protein [Kiritimatiellae bacterium]|nr:universal stress protein [Kiritimatiellia bacterium]